MSFQNSTSYKFAMVLLLCSYGCSDNTSNTTFHFQALNESLTNASRNIAQENGFLLSALEEKLYDPVTHYKAAIWQPKAAQIHSYASAVTSHIESLKTDLYNAYKHRGETKEGTANVYFFFKEEGRGQSLFNRLMTFKQKAVSVDAHLYSEFSNLKLLPYALDSAMHTEQRFLDLYFQNTSYVAAQALLSQLLSNVLMAEKRLLQFCSEQYTSHKNFESYSAIIAQSSNYVRAGTSIEITAGMGAFNTRDQPKIAINGKDVPLSENGTANYTFKASKKEGKHYMPVEIEYTDQKGKRQTITKAVAYTVAH